MAVAGYLAGWIELLTGYRVLSWSGESGYLSPRPDETRRDPRARDKAKLHPVKH